MVDRRKVVSGGIAVALLAGGAYLAWEAADDDEDRATVPEPALELPPGTIAAVDNDYPVDDVTVAAGQPLTFENRGSSRHTLTADDGRFDSGVVEPGDTFQVSLDGPREIPVHCEIHPTMRAMVTVTAP